MSSRRDFEGAGFSFVPVQKKRHLLPSWTLTVQCTPSTTINTLITQGASRMREIDCGEVLLELVDISKSLFHSIKNDQRFRLVDESPITPSNRNCSAYLNDPNFIPICEQHCMWRYRVSELTLYTRERKGKVRANGIASHKLHSVDNTGNIRVWSSEPQLLAYILDKDIARDARILELGGGMTALAGLGAAVFGCAHAVLTDGHPDCVSNQGVCIQLNQQLGVLGNNAEVKLLRWDSEEDLGSVCSEGLFDLVLVADCLFFQQCHEDLVQVLRNTLASNGRALLLQPPRSGTTAAFMALAQPWFDIHRDDTFPHLGSEIHLEYLKDPRYDADIHRPMLLVLTHRILDDRV